MFRLDVFAKKRGAIGMPLCGCLAALLFRTAFCPAALAAQQTPAATQGASAASWGYLAAALAVGLSSLGAGLAVAVVGSAAMGAMSEKPELAGRALIFLGLAEGIAIYGLIVAVMILGKL